jgi:hypothetical protein
VAKPKNMKIYSKNNMITPVNAGGKPKQKKIRKPKYNILSKIPKNPFVD